MSGPKCGQARLNHQRAEVLRVQREREERVRRARERQRRDERRRQSVDKGARLAREHLDHALGMLTGSSTELVMQYAQTELQELQHEAGILMEAIDAAKAQAAAVEPAYQAALRDWQQRNDGIDDEFDRIIQAHRRLQANSELRIYEKVQADLERIQQRFGNESYEGGYYDKIDMADLNRRTELLIQRSRDIVARARARSAEEQARRNDDRVQAGVEQARVQIGIARTQREDLRAAGVDPELLAAIDSDIAAAETLLTHDDRATSTPQVQAAVARIQAQVSRAREQLAAWQARRASMAASADEARQRVDALDQEFLQTWAPQELAHILQRLSELEGRVPAQMGLYDEAIDLDAFRTALEEATATALTSADERSAKEMERAEIVITLVDVLRDMNYNVGDELADDSNPLSDVLIHARHAGGQYAEMRVNTEGRVDMDWRKGLTCEEDVEQLIEQLNQHGVDFTMLDWGNAQPDRRRRTRSDEADASSSAEITADR